MALVTDFQHAGSAVERLRRRSAFHAARRHSRLVRRLRVILPLAGLSVVLAFVIATRLALPDDLDLSVARLSVTPNSIIMDNPRLTGFDADQRSYSVTADRAIQSLGDPQQVALEKITAEVTVTGQGTATVRAAAGDYDNAEGKLRLEGGIVLQSTQGYALSMDDADIDFRGGTMASPNAVRVTYQGSETTGRSIAVSGGGRVIVLEGVRTTLLPPKRASTPAASPAERQPR